MEKQLIFTSISKVTSQHRRYILYCTLTLIKLLRNGTWALQNNHSNLTFIRLIITSVSKQIRFIIKKQEVYMRWSCSKMIVHGPWTQKWKLNGVTKWAFELISWWPQWSAFECVKPINSFYYGLECCKIFYYLS